MDIEIRKFIDTDISGMISVWNEVVMEGNAATTRRVA